MSTWGDHARNVITQALESGRTQGLEGMDLERYVQAQYPYGPRENWPYKAWCKAFNEIVKGVRHGKPKPQRTSATLPGQGELF